MIPTPSPGQANMAFAGGMSPVYQQYGPGYGSPQVPQPAVTGYPNRENRISELPAARQDEVHELQ